MYRVRIKICGITDSASLNVAAAEGADAIGFVLAESPRRLSIRQARQLRSELPPYVAPVAVLKRAEPEEIVELVRDELFPQVQVDAECSAYMDFEGLEHAVIPVVRVGSEAFDIVRGDPKRIGRFALIEGARSGAGERVDWNVVAPISEKINVILAGGLNPENVADAIRTVWPYAVDVSSGVESSPGKKDPGKIRAFVQAVRSVEREISS